MSKEKVVTILLSQVSNRFDVRTRMDEDRIIQIAGCYESGMELPPIRVVAVGNDDTYAYVDGRHRGAAREFLNLKDVQAVILDNPNDPAELFAQALEANWGGSKPPTRDDISHTVLRLMEMGCSRKAISERLDFVPKGSLKAYMATAQGHIMRRRIGKAMDAISEGASIETAASQAKVPLDTLRDIITGKKGKWGGARTNEAELMMAIKSYISTELRSANSGIGKKMEVVLAKVESGEVSYKGAYGVVRAWSEHLRKSSIRVADWRARLNAISGEGETAAVLDSDSETAGAVQ